MERPILLVEDRPDDVELTIRAFKKNKIANEVVVARDGAEALDYLFGTGKQAGRDLSNPPCLILLDLTARRHRLRSRLSGWSLTGDSHCHESVPPHRLTPGR